MKRKRTAEEWAREWCRNCDFQDGDGSCTERPSCLALKPLAELVRRILRANAREAYVRGYREGQLQMRNRTGGGCTPSHTFPVLDPPKAERRGRGR